MNKAGAGYAGRRQRGVAATMPGWPGRDGIMVGILIIAHGNLGESLIHCANHVFGTRPPRLGALSVSVHDDPAVLLPRARALVAELDDGSGVLVLSDIYGATPCNVGCQLLQAGRVEVVAGVNLPMLVRVLTYREQPLQVVVEKAVTGGREGVIEVSKEACRVATGR
jgi:PTS system ascorbate-specific IIA component